MICRYSASYLTALDSRLKLCCSAVQSWTDDAAPRKILGFHALSAAQVVVRQLSDTKLKKLLRHPVPCFRMAPASDRRAAGLGEILIDCAVD